MPENWLRQRMQEVGISTDVELARLLELEGLSYTPGAVGHWATGTRKPPFHKSDFREGLARVLKLTEAEMLRRAGYSAANPRRSKEAEIAADIVDDLPPDKKKMAVRILEVMRTG